jgi:chemotaxis signal transduction protein
LAFKDASLSPCHRRADKKRVQSETQRSLVVFRLNDRLAAFPLDAVDRIRPMAALARPPSLPSLLEGFLIERDSATAVLRLDRLLNLPPRSPGLYSMLIVFKETCAVLVDRVLEIRPVDASLWLPLQEPDSFNGCAEATVRVPDEWKPDQSGPGPSTMNQSIPVLSPRRVLLEKERAVLKEFQQITEERLAEWRQITLTGRNWGAEPA